METKKIKTLTLPVEGMTCASCVARVEKALKKVDGVDGVNVNFATEKVTLTFNEEKADFVKLSEVVEDAGYKLIAPKEGEKDSEDQKVPEAEEENLSQKRSYVQLKSEFIFAAVMAVPIMFLSMANTTVWFHRLTPISAEYIDRILFLASTLVIFISGKRFFTISWKLLKHFSADMNTLVAVGTGTAYVYSTIAVLFPKLLSLTGSSGHVYFDTSVMIIALI